LPIVIACPSGHRLKVPTKYQGRRIVCPVCGEGIDVPGQAVAAVANPPKKRHLPPKPVASKPLSKPSAPKPVTPEFPELPSTTKPVAKMAKPEPEPQEFKPAFDPPGQESPYTPVAPASAPISDPSPLVETLDPPTTPDPPFPSAPLYGEEAIEAASMMASEENLFPEIRIDTEHDVEVDVRQLAMSADPVQARFHSVLMLAIGSILVAVFCLVPSIVEQTVARQTGMRPPDTWSYIVILFAIVQIAISIYTIRIPDWSTVRMVAVVATSLAAIYAAGLALSMFANQGNGLVRLLGLPDEVFHYRAQPWCFLAMCILLTLAFCCGKYSVGWQQSEMQLKESQTAVT